MLHLRFNRSGGGFVWIATSLSDWIRHPTNLSVDCATIQLPLPRDADVLAYLGIQQNALTDAAISKLGIGAGDEVFFPGLFVKHSGAQQNVPIVRTGTIAAMLTGPIESARGPINGYLVEARSIGGLSGSPAFVQIPPEHPWVTDPDAEKQPAMKRFVPRFFFFGLIHGHWDVRPMSDHLVEDGLSDEAVNMGIAIVIPATDVMEVLDHPTIVKLIDAAKAKSVASAQPTPDVSR